MTDDVITTPCSYKHALTLRWGRHFYLQPSSMDMDMRVHRPVLEGNGQWNKSLIILASAM